MSLGICWDALGKPRAETAAWKRAEEKGLKPAKTGQNRPPSVQVQDFLVEIQWTQFLILKVSSKYSFVHNE